MSKGFTKWIGVASALLVFLMLATGCAAWFAPAGDPVEVETTTVPETETETETEPEPEEVVDFGGRTIKVATWWDLTPQEGTVTGDRQAARIAELQEKFNFTVEWVNVPWGEFSEAVSASVMAGDPIGDKIWQDPWWYFNMAMRGFLQPLDQFYDLTDPQWNPTATEFATIDGVTYGVYHGSRVHGSVLFFNKAIFEREGLPNLYELVRNRQWTWDKFVEVAKQATKDLDGDGVIDQFGFGGINMPLKVIYANTGSKMQIIDGRPTITFGEPVAMEAIQLWIDLMHVHKAEDIGPDGSPWDYAIHRFKDGKTAMFSGDHWMTDVFADMPDDYGITLFPMMPRATEYVSQGEGPVVLTIPVGVKDPEQVAMFWKRWVAPYPEQLEDPDYWLPDFAASLRDEESIETFRYIWENNITTHSLARGFQTSREAWWGLGWEVVHGGLTPSVIAEERIAPLQTLLDDEFRALRGE